MNLPVLLNATPRLLEVAWLSHLKILQERCAFNYLPLGFASTTSFTPSRIDNRPLSGPSLRTGFEPARYDGPALTTYSKRLLCATGATDRLCNGFPVSIRATNSYSLELRRPCDACPTALPRTNLRNWMHHSHTMEVPLSPTTTSPKAYCGSSPVVRCDLEVQHLDFTLCNRRKPIVAFTVINQFACISLTSYYPLNYGITNRNHLPSLVFALLVFTLKGGQMFFTCYFTLFCL
ncbi:hypothetical protein CC79DRAFT_1331548 [Sarocladium strictum]